MPLEEIIDSDLYASAKNLILTDANNRNEDPTPARTEELLNLHWTSEIEAWELSPEQVSKLATVLTESITQL